MIYRDYVESDVERLLDELCIGLGLCLSPDDVRRLEESPPGDVDSFIAAVFDASPDASRDADLRHRARAVVERHMSGWEAGDEASGGWWAPL